LAREKREKKHKRRNMTVSGSALYWEKPHEKIEEWGIMHQGGLHMEKKKEVSGNDEGKQDV
jgi:hypothetical protein